MASPLADKIKATKNAFPAQKPGAVAACPYTPPVEAESPQQVEVKTSFALTQDILSSPAAQRSQEQKQQKSWVEILLVDLEGNPVPGVRYRVTTPDGEVREGTLNEHGQAGYYHIDPGNCKITFPDLDKDAWD